MDMSYFNYCQGLTMTNGRFDDLSGARPGGRRRPFTQREMDIAASIQAVTEEIMLRMARHVSTRDRDEELVPGRRRGAELRRQRADPAGGPSTTSGSSRPPATPGAPSARPCSCGTSSWTAATLRRRARPADGDHCWDRAYANERDPGVPRRHRRPATSYYENEEVLLDVVTEQIVAEKVVGTFQGRMEFGPRALGAAASSATPGRAKMQSVMNLKIKFRESFRPFAPCVLREHVQE